MHILLFFLFLFGDATSSWSASSAGAYGKFKAEPKGNYSAFVRSLKSKSSHGYKLVSEPEPIRAGKVSERFELRRGDCTGIPEWDDCKTDRERTELVQLAPYTAENQDHWFAWSIFIPKDYKNIFPVKVALGQFHQKGSSRPPLMFQNGSGGYWADLNQLDKPHELLIPESQLKNRWQDILVNVRWSRGADGFLKIWVNKELKFSHTGQNLKSAGPIFFKYGIYRSFLSRAKKGTLIPDQVVYFDEVKWGKSRAEVELDKPSP